MSPKGDCGQKGRGSVPGSSTQHPGGAWGLLYRCAHIAPALVECGPPFGTCMVNIACPMT